MSFIKFHELKKKVDEAAERRASYSWKPIYFIDDNPHEYQWMKYKKDRDPAHEDFKKDFEAMIRQWPVFTATQRKEAMQEYIKRAASVNYTSLHDQIMGTLPPEDARVTIERASETVQRTPGI